MNLGHGLLHDGRPRDFLSALNPSRSEAQPSNSRLVATEGAAQSKRANAGLGSIAA